MEQAENTKKVRYHPNLLLRIIPGYAAVATVPRPLLLLPEKNPGCPVKILDAKGKPLTKSAGPCKMTFVDVLSGILIAAGIGGLTQEAL
ncbi:hypothetical protein SDC9_148141 [bioreactor metagenome]|uniref:Uncharacterized protein n=1 Tax=bioreactor metagenome TaxID=1076179 RepID=A0A645EK59_9ZZZZ